jgi:signal transduction histidine kinase
LLVAFDVFTVSISLYLNNRIVSIYTKSVQVNQGWADRLHEASELGQLAATANAPGNDVFETQDVEVESRKMQAAVRAFKAQGTALHDSLEGMGQAEPLLETLAAVQAAMADMVVEADRIFTHLRTDQVREAGRQMALMDRKYAAVNTALVRLRQQIEARQQANFRQQTASAAALQRFEYLIGSLILVMIGAAAVYGHKMNRRLEADAQEKDHLIGALRESETFLEKRVQERTAEVRKAHAVRSQLLKRLMSAQEDERRRIARDLHDEIGQGLTSVLVGLRTVEESPTFAAAKDQARELRRLGGQIHDDVRRLARGLRPSILDDLGLEEALRRYAEDYQQMHGISAVVHSSGSALARLPEEVETALYRIAQEALTNTAKHAAAGCVQIVVTRDPSFVQLTVADDGCGFEPETMPARPTPDGSFGLPGMRERAALLNGSLILESAPGQGTTITVRIPLGESGHG